MKRAAALFLLLLATAGVAPNASAQTEAPVSRPNILVIVTDDQRATRLGGFQPGTKRWLQDNGTTFTNAYASTPICCPSRASIFSGRYAHNHRVLSNGDGEVLDHSTSMQAYLQEAGYRTGIVGKLLNGWPLRKDPPYWSSFSISRGGYRESFWNINGTRKTINAYHTKFVGYRAADFIRHSEARDARPWMLYVATKAPHRSWEPARQYADSPVNRWKGNPAVRERDLRDKPPWLRDGSCRLRCGRRIRAGQNRLLMSVDDLVLKMREKLKKYGERDTLVVYVSDNGYTWGEHGLEKKSQPYVQSVRVPLMIRWPGHTQGRTLDERFALNIDIAPTVLEAADIAVGETPMDGRSLLVDSARNRVHLEHWCNVRDSCDRWASTRTHAYQYIERYDKEGNVLFREYYNNVSDPWQLTNLLRDRDRTNNPDVARLDAQLEPDRSCVGTRPRQRGNLPLPGVVCP